MVDGPRRRRLPPNRSLRSSSPRLRSTARQGPTRGSATGLRHGHLRLPPPRPHHRDRAAHNFAEGLAIGNSAAGGELSLALLLGVGFGLHNATEGFGIVAPLTGHRPSWAYLALLGLIGGGPTFLGTIVGQNFVNETISIAFLGLAGGSILYVVIELLAVARKTALKVVTTWGLLLGLVLGFLTDAVVTAAGA